MGWPRSLARDTTVESATAMAGTMMVALPVSARRKTAEAAVVMRSGERDTTTGRGCPPRTGPDYPAWLRSGSPDAGDLGSPRFPT